MNDRQQGLVEKYRVERRDGKPLKGGCIVLEFGDPTAWPAIKTWANTVEADGYSVLAADVRARLDAAADAWERGLRPAEEGSEGVRLVECSECGHKHFDKVAGDYVPCPLAPKCDCILGSDPMGDRLATIDYTLTKHGWAYVGADDARWLVAALAAERAEVQRLREVGMWRKDVPPLVAMLQAERAANDRLVEINKEALALHLAAEDDLDAERALSDALAAAHEAWANTDRVRDAANLTAAALAAWRSARAGLTP